MPSEVNLLDSLQLEFSKAETLNHNKPIFELIYIVGHVLYTKDILFLFSQKGLKSALKYTNDTLSDNVPCRTEGLHLIR